MLWNQWDYNDYTGMVVSVDYELKFSNSPKGNIPANTKGLVLQRCLFTSQETGEYEVYHVYFPNYGAVYVNTEDLSIIDE